MSDYFGALLRSSGLASPAPRAAEPTPGLEPTDVEVATSPLAAAPAAPADPGARRVEPLRAEPVAQPPGAAPRPSALEDVAKPIAAAPDEVPAVPAPSIAPSEHRIAPPLAVTTPHAFARTESPSPDLGPTLVQAALRWVAADPAARRGVAAPDPGPAVGRADADVTAPTAEPAALPELRAPIESAGEPPSLSLRPAAARPDRPPVPAMPIRAVPATPRTPAAPPPSAPREEAFEVSIGAIHVRVDAPAAQTIARPASPPPAARPIAAVESRRSGLARRALRRI